MSVDQSGLVDVCVSESSPLAGVTLKTAPLPARVFILSLERRGAVTVPTGDAALEVGDCLTALGDSVGLEELATLAGGLDRA
jgi:Trk K+ transport system NAD-binding subunit